MEDVNTQQGTVIRDPNQDAANLEKNNQANTQQGLKNAGDAAAQQQNTGLGGGLAKVNVVSNSEALQDHIDDNKDDVAEAERQVLETVPTEHHGKIREIFMKLHNGMTDLLRHATHNSNEAKQAEEQQKATAGNATQAVTTGTGAAPRSTATSDAHRNVGNGGAVTGNPAASFSQASAAQIAVDQGAKLPGVATEPQPDAHVR